MSYEVEPVRTEGMDLVIISDALPIPITLAEVKAHLSVDFNDQDTYLESLLASAFKEVELFVQKGLKTKTVRQSYKSINGTVELMFSPIQSITTVKDFDNADVSYSTSYDKTKITAYSAKGIVVTFVGGFTTLPADLKFAILDIVAVDFDNSAQDKKKAIMEIKDRIRHYRPFYV